MPSTPGDSGEQSLLLANRTLSLAKWYNMKFWPFHYFHLFKSYQFFFALKESEAMCIVTLLKQHIINRKTKLTEVGNIVCDGVGTAAGNGHSMRSCGLHITWEHLPQGVSTSGLFIGIWTRRFVAIGAVLYTLGCLAGCWPGLNRCRGTIPHPQLKQPEMSLDIAKCPLSGEMSTGWNCCFNNNTNSQQLVKL